MTRRIDYKFLHPGTPQFLELADFAKEFDHEIVPHPQINVCGHYKSGKLIGYSDHVYIPTIYPAFHPNHTSPRDVVQILSDFVSHVQFSRGIGYIGVPLEQDRPNFRNETMKKLGLTSMNREVFSIDSTEE
jgi:hypothetical protein